MSVVLTVPSPAIHRRLSSSAIASNSAVRFVAASWASVGVPPSSAAKALSSRVARRASFVLPSIRRFTVTTILASYPAGNWPVSTTYRRRIPGLFLVAVILLAADGRPGLGRARRCGDQGGDRPARVRAGDRAGLN